MRISDWSSDVCSSDLDLQHQREPGEHAEIPEIIQVARHGIARADSIVDETGKRHAQIDPAHQRVLRLVLFSPGEAHCSIPPPTWTPASDLKDYSGTPRFAGAGPDRQRVAWGKSEEGRGEYGGETD